MRGKLVVISWIDVVKDIKFKHPKYSYRQIASIIKNYGYLDWEDLDEMATYIKACIREDKEMNTDTYTSSSIGTDKKTIEYTNNGNLTSSKVIQICENEIDLSPERIMKLHDINPSEWEVVTYKNNYWQSQQKGGKVIDLYQSKLTVKPKEIKIGYEDIKEIFYELDRKYEPRIYRDSNTEYTGSKIMEINISDLHLGKYFYDDRNGKEYNTKGMIDVFNNLVKQIVNILHNDYFDKVLFIFSNDLFNSDGISKTTTSGTPQDTDMDWKQLFRVACDIVINAIDNFCECNDRLIPVDIIYTPSNHDMQVSWYFIEFLKAWYRNNPYISIDDTFYPRKYVRYGKNLIGFSHGDEKIKIDRFASLMSLEAKEDWAITDYREYHLAHLHSEHMIEEVNGVLIRRCSSPVFADQYHVSKGYCNNDRKCQLFIYDKEDGLVTIHNIKVK